MRLKSAKKRTPPSMQTWRPKSAGTTFQNPYAQGKHMKPMMGQAVFQEKKKAEALKKARKRFSLKDWLKRLWIF